MAKRDLVVPASTPHLGSPKNPREIPGVIPIYYGHIREAPPKRDPFQVLFLYIRDILEAIVFTS